MDEFRQFLKEYKWRVIGIAGGILLAVLIFTIGFSVMPDLSNTSS